MQRKQMIPNVWDISENYCDFVMYITEKTCCIYVLIKIYLQIKIYYNGIIS